MLTNWIEYILKEYIMKKWVLSQKRKKLNAWKQVNVIHSINRLKNAFDEIWHPFFIKK